MMYGMPMANELSMVALGKVVKRDSPTGHLNPIDSMHSRRSRGRLEVLQPRNIGLVYIVRCQISG